MSLKNNKKVQKFVNRVKGIKDKKGKFGVVMNEFKQGSLMSSSGYQVTNERQARAIAYSMAYGKQKGYKRTPLQEKRKSLFSRLLGLFRKS